MEIGGNNMSSISETDIEIFSEWATKNEDKNIFPYICKEEKSYYLDRNSEETYMMDYSFQTLAELKKALKQYSGLEDDEEMLKMMTIEICKYRFKCNMEIHKFEDNRQEQRKIKNGEKTLPDYIYVF